MERVSLVGAGVLLVVACGDNDELPRDAAIADGPASVDAPIDADPRTTIAPGAPFVIGPDTPAGRQDEDPAIAVDASGSLFAAWYSNRGTVGAGPLDKQIYATRSTDGVTWSPPSQVSRSTTGTDWSFAPSLAIGPTGSLVASWWNVHLLPDGCTPMVDCTGTHNSILATTSADGLAWSAPIESVAGGPGDWLPAVVVDAVAARTLVYFAAVARRADGTVDLGETTSRLFVVVKTGAAWGAVTPLSGTSAANTHQSYPFVVQRADGPFLMPGTRFATTGPGGPLDVLGTPTSETLVATSTDGIAWTDVRVVSEGAAAFVDVFPSLHADHAGAWWVTWVTTDGASAGHAVELPVSGTYPADRVVRSELAGYSPRVLATATPGVYWGVWVDGTEPTQRVRGRFFTK